MENEIIIDAQDNDLQTSSEDLIKINLAWQLIRDQYISKVKENSLEAPMLCMFKFRMAIAENGSNCQFITVPRGCDWWKKIMEKCPNHSFYESSFVPESMYMIYIQFPSYHDPINACVGSLKMFYMDDDSEITPQLFEESLEEEEPEKFSTIRKRNIKSE